MKCNVTQPAMRRCGDSAHQHITQSPHHQIGFTLTELLVVIGIIVLLIAVGLPSVKAMFASGHRDQAYTMVSSAESAARTYATRTRIVNPDHDSLPYMGAAAVFMEDPDGLLEIHVVQHRYTDYSSQDNSIYYRVIDPVVLASNVGIAGILSEGKLVVPPPTNASGLPTSPYGFAIRFDSNGILSSKPQTANDPDSVMFNINPPSSNTVTNQRFDAVVGVILYDKLAFQNSGSFATGTLTSGGAYNWILANGTPMLFNRYTGTVMRER